MGLLSESISAQTSDLRGLSPDWLPLDCLRNLPLPGPFLSLWICTRVQATFSWQLMLVSLPLKKQLWRSNPERRGIRLLDTARPYQRPNLDLLRLSHPEISIGVSTAMLTKKHPIIPTYPPVVVSPVVRGLCCQSGLSLPLITLRPGNLTQRLWALFLFWPLFFWILSYTIQHHVSVCKHAFEPFSGIVDHSRWFVLLFPPSCAVSSRPVSYWHRR